MMVLIGKMEDGETLRLVASGNRARFGVLGVRLGRISGMGIRCCRKVIRGVVVITNLGYLINLILPLQKGFFREELPKYTANTPHIDFRAIGLRA